MCQLSILITDDGNLHPMTRGIVTDKRVNDFTFIIIALPITYWQTDIAILGISRTYYCL